MGNPINPQFNKFSAFGQPYADVGKGVQSAMPGTNAGNKMPNAGGWIGMGANAVTGLGQLMPTPYDQRIGMERPSFFKEMTDLTFTGMGAAVGGPWGALAGAVVDTGKNIGAYLNKQAQYKTGVQKYRNNAAMNERLATMEGDYTGAAKYGMKVPSYAFGGNVPDIPAAQVPVELEQSEAIIMPQMDGSYSWVGETDANAPSHEQGGVKTTLPEGALVFPQKYVNDLKMAMQNQDWNSVGQMADMMMQESAAASEQGLPFSNQMKPQMFGDGGMVIAETVKNYNPIEDKGRKAANQILADIQQHMNMGNISQDEADVLISGLMSRVNPEHEISKEFKASYPDIHEYFIGEDQGTKKVDLFPTGVKDVIDYQTKDELGNMHSNMGTNRAQLMHGVEYGIQDKGKYYSSYQDKKTMDDFDPNQYYSFLKNVDTGSSGSNAPIGIQPIVDNSVVGQERTKTRQAAMNSGVYYGKNGEALTYWDDKTGKRMFNSAAAQYGLKGEFAPTSKYTPVQTKSAGTSGTSSGKTSSQGNDVPTISLSDEELNKEQKLETPPNSKWDPERKAWVVNKDFDNKDLDEWQKKVAKNNVVSNSAYNEKMQKQFPMVMQQSQERASGFKSPEQLVAERKPKGKENQFPTISTPQSHKSALSKFSGDVFGSKEMATWLRSEKEMSKPTMGVDRFGFGGFDNETMNMQPLSDRGMDRVGKSLMDEKSKSASSAQEKYKQAEKYSQMRDIINKHLTKGTLPNEFRNIVKNEEIANEYAKLFHEKKQMPSFSQK